MYNFAPHSTVTCLFISYKLSTRLGETMQYISIAGHYRNRPWPAVPDWCWCRNTDAGLTQRTSGKTNDAGLTFSPAFRYSGISIFWHTVLTRADTKFQRTEAYSILTKYCKNLLKFLKCWQNIVKFGRCFDILTRYCKISSKFQFTNFAPCSSYCKV
jgi:hypothetical protein